MNPRLTSAAVPLLSLALFAIACGGGGGESASSSTEASYINLEAHLVQAVESRSKTANLPADTPLVITSDALDRFDPKEATHAKAVLRDSAGVVIAQKQQAILRSSTPPYEVDNSSRTILLEKILLGENYSLSIILGKDLGVNELNRQEIIFYRGDLKRLSLTLDGVFIDGAKQARLKVPVGLNVDPSTGSLSLQGYIDYRGIPAVSGNSSELSDAPKDSSTSFFTVGTFINSQASNKVLREIDQPLAHFFELIGVKTDTQGLLALSQSGDPKHIVISGLFTREEILLGKPLLMDWETTFAVALGLWHLGFPVTDVSVSHLLPHYTRYLKLVQLLDKKVSDFSTGQSIPVLTPEEAVTYKLYYQIAELTLRGDPLGIIASPSKITNKVMQFLSFDPMAGVNHFFLSNNRSARFLGNGVDYTPKGAISLVDTQFLAFVSGNTIIDGVAIKTLLDRWVPN